MLTGQDVHKAFIATYPYLQPNWHELKSYSQEGYEKVARELNSILEQDKVSITAIKCPSCGEMLANLKGHPCLLESATLAEYRHSLEKQSEDMLKNLVEDYELSSKYGNKPSYIDALVEDFKKQLEANR
jgi:hypothetical protein